MNDLPSITIDRPRGYEKRWNTPRGPRFATYPTDYGFFDDYISPQDGKGVDVFVGREGTLFGRFMKGQETSQGWQPDEHKYFAKITPAEWSAIQDMYNHKQNNLLRDIRIFKTIQELQQDLQDTYGGAKRAELSFTPDFTPADLRQMGVYDELYAGTKPALASLRTWPKHWLHADDPNGWAEWYEKYSAGRKHPDDERQLKRWHSMKRRHLAQYLKNPTPRRAYALRNWAVDAPRYLDEELQDRARADMQEYAAALAARKLRQPVAVPWSAAKKGAVDIRKLQRNPQNAVMIFNDLYQDKTACLELATFFRQVGRYDLGLDDEWLGGADTVAPLDTLYGELYFTNQHKTASVNQTLRTQLQLLGQSYD